MHRERSVGALVARVSGSGTTTVLMLHGLGATSDYWPGAYDVLDDVARVVVPDLLGFGRSLDESRSSFTLANHLDALDSCVELAAPGAQRIVVVAHSMGSAVALGFAGRHPDRTAHVILVGAPVYADPDAATGAFDTGGAMGRLFLLDTDWARRLCALSCRARSLSGAVMALGEPRLPIPIARRASLHTWEAYRDSVEQLILHHDWQRAFDAVIGAGIELDLYHGSDDTIGDQTHIERLVGGRAGVALHTVDDADHHLAITHAGTVLSRIREIVATDLSRVST